MRIAVIDDDVAFRRELLGYVGAAAATPVDDYGPRAFVEAPETELYDLIVIDPFPGATDHDAGLMACARTRSARVVVVTHRGDVNALAEAARHRVAGYLLKTDGVDAMGEAIVNLLDRGQPAVSPALAPTLFALATAGRKPGRTRVLTDREIEVLRWVGRGSSNRDIAQRLGIAENTVKNHVRHILDKLHVRSRLGAVLIAVRDGVIDVDALD